MPLIGHCPPFEGIDRTVHCLAGQNKIHVSVLDGNGGKIQCIGCFDLGDIKPPFKSKNDGCERVMGLEPTISCLGSKRSTTELHPLDGWDYTPAKRGLSIQYENLHIRFRPFQLLVPFQ